jgi:hypothetical protein
MVSKYYVFAHFLQSGVKHGSLELRPIGWGFVFLILMISLHFHSHFDLKCSCIHESDPPKMSIFVSCLTI